MKNSQKGFVVLLIIVIGILVVGGAVYFYSQNSNKGPVVNDPAEPIPVPGNNTIDEPNNYKPANSLPVSSGWKTYSDSKWGFQFDYPKESGEVVATCGDGDCVGQNVFFSVRNPYKTNPGRSYISLTIYKNQIQGDFELFVKKIWEDNKVKKDNIVGKLEQITVGEEKGYKFTTSKYFNSPWEGSLLNEPTAFIFVNKDNALYFFKYPTSEKVSESILSSFKFTK